MNRKWLLSWQNRRENGSLSSQASTQNNCGFVKWLQGLHVCTPGHSCSNHSLCRAATVGNGGISFRSCSHLPSCILVSRSATINCVYMKVPEWRLMVLVNTIRCNMCRTNFRSRCCLRTTPATIGSIVHGDDRCS